LSWYPFSLTSALTMSSLVRDIGEHPLFWLESGARGWQNDKRSSGNLLF